MKIVGGRRYLHTMTAMDLRRTGTRHPSRPGRRSRLRSRQARRLPALARAESVRCRPATRHGRDHSHPARAAAESVRPRGPAAARLPGRRPPGAPTGCHPIASPNWRPRQGSRCTPGWSAITPAWSRRSICWQAADDRFGQIGPSRRINSPSPINTTGSTTWRYLARAPAMTGRVARYRPAAHHSPTPRRKTTR